MTCGNNHQELQPPCIDATGGFDEHCYACGGMTDWWNCPAFLQYEDAFDGEE